MNMKARYDFRVWLNDLFKKWFTYIKHCVLCLQINYIFYDTILLLFDFMICAIFHFVTFEI